MPNNAGPMTQDNMVELKPCPFCSARAEAYIAFPQSDYPWHVSVQHGERCPMRITDSHCYRDQAELVECWNTRATMHGSPEPLSLAEQSRRVTDKKTRLLREAVERRRATMHGSDSGVTEAMLDAGSRVSFAWGGLTGDEAERVYVAMSSASAPDSGALREALVEARAWIFECWGWLMETDLDMTCPMQTDPLDIVEKIDALVGIDAALNLSSETGE